MNTTGSAVTRADTSLFSTAGGGFAPVEFLRDTAVHDIAIKAVLVLPASTEAKFSPDLAPRIVNTWRLVAERGLYAYDCSPVRRHRSSR